MTKAILTDLAGDSRSEWAGPSPLRGLQEAGVFGFLLACAVITVLTTVGIILVLGVETVHFFPGGRGVRHRLSLRARA